MRIHLFLRSLRGKKRRQPGPLRRTLRRLGPTWERAPVRRLVQAACFVAFLWLFFVVAWPYGSPEYAQTLADKEVVDAELFLALDPLVSISTALAARTWVWSLAFAAVMLLTGLFFPRGFCGYVCPLGTLIDLFDWALGRRVKRFRVESDGWWVHLRFYLLAAVLAAAAFGVLLSGFVAAIPVLTRGLMFFLGPVQSGLLRDWYLVTPVNAGHVVSLVLFFGVLALGFWRPRFWCRHVCPTGALFSLAAMLRLTQRTVTSTCVECGICVASCSFDAIGSDFQTRTEACTFCQTCGGACPTGAILFVDRWHGEDLKTVDEPERRAATLTRRGLVTGAAAGALAALGVRHAWGAGPDDAARTGPVRPPGSVPEGDFLAQCVRCGECLQACPNDVLQSQGFAQGLEGLWTPFAQLDWSGCDPRCANCGQVCPTGAIRALSLEEKSAARMGLAVVDETTCLPFAGREPCQMCVDECDAAGYRAIEFMRVHPELDDDGFPLPDTGFSAPIVSESLCVGCGLCQSRCRHINVDEKGLLARSAIVVQAGPGREDRLQSGSYVELRRERETQTDEGFEDGGDYLPDFMEDE